MIRRTAFGAARPGKARACEAVLLALAMITACGSSDAPEASAGSGAPAMSAAEVKRSREACQAYVDQACACAAKVPAAKPACDAARAVPDSIRLALGVASNAESKPEDVRHAQRFVRDAVSECIQETAKLPTLGCAQ